MGTVEKPKTPPPSRGAREGRGAPGAHGRRRESPTPLAGARAALVLDRKPYLKMAFANPYNLSLFARRARRGGPHAEPGPRGRGAGPRRRCGCSTRRTASACSTSSGIRGSRSSARPSRRRSGPSASPRVGEAERKRVDGLVARQEQIRRLAAQNPSFTGDLLRNELVKTDRLVDAFVDMAVTCARYEAYLDSVDHDDLEKDRTRYEQAVEGRGSRRPAHRDREEEPGHRGAPAREDAGDPALPQRGPRAARPHRELVPAHRRPDRHDAVAAGALGPARRAAGRRGGDPPDRAGHGEDPERLGSRRRCDVAEAGSRPAPLAPSLASFPPGPRTSAAATSGAKPPCSSCTATSTTSCSTAGRCSRSRTS